MLNNIVGYWAYIQGTYVWDQLGGLYLEWGELVLYSEVYSIQFKKACIFLS